MKPRKLVFIGGTFYISLYKQDMIHLNAIKNDLVNIENIQLLSPEEVKKFNKLKQLLNKK